MIAPLRATGAVAPFLTVALAALFVAAFVVNYYLLPNYHVVSSLYAIPVLVASHYVSARGIAVTGAAAVAIYLVNAFIEDRPLLVWPLGVAALTLVAYLAVLFATQKARAAEVPATPSSGQQATTGTRWATTRALVSELRAPVALGMLVATSAYMVHGLLPVLATDYAGLTPGEAGVIYTLSPSYSSRPVPSSVGSPTAAGTSSVRRGAPRPISDRPWASWSVRHSEGSPPPRPWTTPGRPRSARPGRS